MLISKFDIITLCKIWTLVDAGCLVNKNFLCNVCRFSVSLKLVQNKSPPPQPQGEQTGMENLYSLWRTEIYFFKKY